MRSLVLLRVLTVLAFFNSFIYGSIEKEALLSFCEKSKSNYNQILANHQSLSAPARAFIQKAYTHGVCIHSNIQLIAKVEKEKEAKSSESLEKITSSPSSSSEQITDTDGENEEEQNDDLDKEEELLDQQDTIMRGVVSFGPLSPKELFLAIPISLAFTDSKARAWLINNNLITTNPDYNSYPPNTHNSFDDLIQSIDAKGCWKPSAWHLIVSTAFIRFKLDQTHLINELKSNNQNENDKCDSNVNDECNDQASDNDNNDDGSLESLWRSMIQNFPSNNRVRARTRDSNDIEDNSLDNENDKNDGCVGLICFHPSEQKKIIYPHLPKDPLLDCSLQITQTLQLIYQHIKPKFIINGNNGMPFSYLVWAASMVISRSQGLPSLNENDELDLNNKVPAFIPLTDMFNHIHSNMTQAHSYAESIGRYSSRSYLTYSQGDLVKCTDPLNNRCEIFDSYLSGPLNNRNLLIMFGFVQKDNIHDEFPIVEKWRQSTGKQSRKGKKGSKALSPEEKGEEFHRSLLFSAFSQVASAGPFKNEIFTHGPSKSVLFASKIFSNGTFHYSYNPFVRLTHTRKVDDEVIFKNKKKDQIIQTMKNLFFNYSDDQASIISLANEQRACQWKLKRINYELDHLVNRTRALYQNIFYLVDNQDYDEEGYIDHSKSENTLNNRYNINPNLPSTKSGSALAIDLAVNHISILTKARILLDKQCVTVVDQLNQAQAQADNSEPQPEPAPQSHSHVHSDSKPIHADYDVDTL